jgi:hypothetical protein
MPAGAPISVSAGSVAEALMACSTTLVRWRLLMITGTDASRRAIRSRRVASRLYVRTFFSSRTSATVFASG